MTTPRDYDIVKGKLPRQDKYGNDVTKDKIGKGGRHREDGTYSSVVYDLEIIDEESPCLKQDFHDNSLAHRSVRYEDLPWWGQVLVEIAEETIPIVVDNLSQVAIQNFQAWLKNRNQYKNRHPSNAVKASNVTKNPKTTTKTEHISQKQNTCQESTNSIQTTVITMPNEFQNAYEQYSINMTSEEAQKEFIDAFILYVLSMKKFKKLSNAKVIDSSGNITDGRKLIEIATEPEVIQQINSLLENKPHLLDEWQSVALANILDRNLTKLPSYEPIDNQKLRDNLLTLNFN